MVLTCIAFVYTVLDLAGVVPGIGEGSVKQVATMIIDILCFVGVVVDPTTAGIKDSARAMTYDEPSKGYEDIED